MALSAGMRTALIILFDLLAVIVAWLGAFALRFNFEWQPGYTQVVWQGLPLLLGLQVLVVWYFDLQRSMWRFVGLREIARVVQAVVVTAFALLLAAFFIQGHIALPRSVVVLYPLLLLFQMAGARAMWRMWREYRQLRQLGATQKSSGATPVIVVGAGSAGALLLRDLLNQPRWHVVALLDDDESKQGLKISGVRVLGGIAHLPQLMAERGVKHVVVAMPTAQRPVLRRISALLEGRNATLLTIPGISELMAGRVSVDALRPVAIEDLLGRDPVSIDNDEVAALIQGGQVLVTGAGGSIGSELCRQVAAFKPALLILLDNSEYALYTIRQWFADNAPKVKVVALTGDVKDSARMHELFKKYRPGLVLHAAAYKHVPLMEVGNAWQAVRNNVLGTLTVARCARLYKARRFVLVSTDKAVNPTNVMGATKRLAEMLCEGLNGTSVGWLGEEGLRLVDTNAVPDAEADATGHVQEFTEYSAESSGTQFIVVRFGNVLGSTGSVIPRFRAQIQAGGPLTVTHPEITRYFMLINEAAQLVLQAATMGSGGEIFVLDMGEPVRIVELARKMIQLSGLTEGQIKIHYSGLRAGEKLYEELLADTELTLPTRHVKLRIARSRPVPEASLRAIALWVSSASTLKDHDVRTALRNWVPEYTVPINEGLAPEAPLTEEQAINAGA